MKRVDIIYFEASSGHKSAALALQYGLQSEHPDWIVRAVDLRDILRRQTRLLDFIYCSGNDFFNWCMRREQYFFFTTCIRSWILFARLSSRWKSLRFLLRWSSTFWADAAPDAVISVTPMFHPIVYESARCVNPSVHCITIPVDYCEMTRGYWFDHRISQHYLVGCDQLRSEAVASGVDDSHVTSLSGMIIDPRFYETRSLDRDSLLTSMGLDPSLPTGLISFGGQGTVNVLRCAAAIASRNIPVNLICLCGKNEHLLKEVRKIKSTSPIVATGFSQAPPVQLHRIADFLIGKPGTMTLTEALITRTAFIFVKSRGLSIVQGANEQWVLQHGIGVMAETAGVVDESVVQVLKNTQMRSSIDACQHRGIFDAVTQITRIMKYPAGQSSEEI